LFPMDCQSTDVEKQDPHQGELGCYLVEGVNLVATCSGDYEPVGLLLWLPRENFYATWDSSHSYIAVFGKDVSWSDIAASPAQYINAQWKGEYDDFAAATCLIPWPTYRSSQPQVYEPQPAYPAAAPDRGGV